jgi:hypothetical protein
MTDIENQYKFSWNLYCELRQETREAQKIRAQVIGFKIAFVSAAYGFIYGAKEFEVNLLLIPAFSAILFDYLIIGYGYSIKRIGYYCRYYLEPKMRGSLSWPNSEPLWEEAMTIPKMSQHFARFGNTGMTIFVCVFAVWSTLSTSEFNLITLINGLLLVGLLFDLYVSYFFKYTPNGLVEGFLDKNGHWKIKQCITSSSTGPGVETPPSP